MHPIWTASSACLLRQYAVSLHHVRFVKRHMINKCWRVVIMFVTVFCMSLTPQSLNNSALLYERFLTKCLGSQIQAKLCQITQIQHKRYFSKYLKNFPFLTLLSAFQLKFDFSACSTASYRVLLYLINHNNSSNLTWTKLHIVLASITQEREGTTHLVPSCGEASPSFSSLMIWLEEQTLALMLVWQCNITTDTSTSILNLRMQVHRRKMKNSSI